MFFIYIYMCMDQYICRSIQYVSIANSTTPLLQCSQERDLSLRFGAALGQQSHWVPHAINQDSNASLIIRWNLDDCGLATQCCTSAELANNDFLTNSVSHLLSLVGNDVSCWPPFALAADAPRLASIAKHFATCHTWPWRRAGDFVPANLGAPLK